MNEATTRCSEHVSDPNVFGVGSDDRRDRHCATKGTDHEEIKTEARKRSENGMYSLIGLDPADVGEAFSKINSTDNDEWAAGFSAVADRYMAEAKAAETTDPAKASTLYV